MNEALVPIPLENNETATATQAGFLWGGCLLEIFSVLDQGGFERLFRLRLATSLREQKALIPLGVPQFRLPGVCVVCRQPSLFTTDYLYASTPDANGHREPSWRERQVCGCGLNCRQRSSYHVLTQLPGLARSSKVYCTEQGELFAHIRSIFPHAVGSEYLGDQVPLGTYNSKGVRNEDMTRLTFSDASLDCIFSLDVLEHVPDYAAALRETARCLQPGGFLLLTVPFHFGQKTTLKRATKNPDGSVNHHLPAVYHSDPIDPKGVLCFNDFGWDLLVALEKAGFVESEFTVFTAPHYGYLGLQFVIVATRGAEPAEKKDSGATAGPRISGAA